MLTQIYCLMSIDKFEEYLDEGFKLDHKTLSVIFRFAVEEMLRRALKSDMEPFSKSQILKLLHPDYEDQVKMLLECREIELKSISEGEKNKKNVMS